MTTKKCAWLYHDLKSSDGSGFKTYRNRTLEMCWPSNWMERYSRAIQSDRNRWTDKKYFTPDNYWFITVDRMPLSAHQLWMVINLLDRATNYSYEQHSMANQLMDWTPSGHITLRRLMISFIDSKKIDKCICAANTKNEYLLQTNWPMSNIKLIFIDKFYATLK